VLQPEGSNDGPIHAEILIDISSILNEYNKKYSFKVAKVYMMIDSIPMMIGGKTTSLPGRRNGILSRDIHQPLAP